MSTDCEQHEHSSSSASSGHKHTSERANGLLRRGECGIPEYGERAWLDLSRKSVAKFAELYGDSFLEQGRKAAGFIKIGRSTHNTLKAATGELHTMFVEATRYVIEHEELWPAFDLPAAFWPKAVASFQRGDKTLTGRFDFSVTSDHGIKVYEYNADSASCLFEAGYSQDAWAKAAGILIGESPAETIEKQLVETWSNFNIPAGSMVHFLLDVDKEEQYHAQYAAEFAEAAGFKVKLCTSVSGFSFAADGSVLDKETEPVKYIWKTWSYTTLLGMWAAANGEPLRTSGEPRLIDVCLSESVMVFEPWWTAVPANKAILPVLWKLYPNHPHLLETTWELTENMKANGYVAKPISGRIGENVSIHSGGALDQVTAVGGRFSKFANVYQELAQLPILCGQYIQVNTWAVNGVYGATVLRVDSSPIINVDSESVCLRVVEDRCTYGELSPSASSVSSSIDEVGK